VDVINAGVLGDIKHIRALWHRNNSWPELDPAGKPKLDAKGNPVYRDGWRKAVDKKDREELEAKLGELDYKSMEELVRWRLFQRTGGGLMAELGSHQLDACSIFLGKVHPLHVSGVGGKFFYRDEREIDDHVFVTFEFPGKHYYKPGTHEVDDKDDVVVVTYSSINTNASEPYGECVMGSRATLVVENEQTALLYPERDPNKKSGDRGLVMTVTTSGGGKPAVDSTATTGLVGAPSNVGGGPAAAGKVSRGYREEMEHFAYCVRTIQGAKGDKDEIKKWQQTPHCHGRVAMADAIIALTSNLAMRHKRRIPFEEKWFDAAELDAVPDAENKATDAEGKEIEIA
jgi:predicted dehydrogenase